LVVAAAMVAVIAVVAVVAEVDVDALTDEMAGEVPLLLELPQPAASTAVAAGSTSIER